MSIYNKILKVQEEAGTIPKSGFNSFNKYAYSTEADVLAVKDLMNLHGLIAFPSVEGYETLYRGKDNESVQTILHIEYTVVDVESGESIKVKVLGQGEDKGDKGAYKASTGANKYFYLKFAGCATGDDPERDDKPEKAAKKTTKAAPTPTPAKQQADKIYTLAKKYKMEAPEVLQACGVSSVAALAEANNLEALQEAYDRLDFYVKENKAS